MINEIKNNFSRGYFGKAMSVSGLDEDYPAWTLKDNEWVGIALPMDQYVPCNEEFSSAQLMSVNDYEIGGRRGPFLILRSFDHASRNEFATVCAQFADPGTNGELRADLLNHPADWWRRWRDLMGNSATENKPYSILGELLVTEILTRNGKNPVWSGAGYGTHDIECDSGSIEVKSTTDRNGGEITISSVYQLMPEPDKPLRLAFVRFEEAPGGITIDHVAERLIELGHDAATLENNLSKLGFPSGRESRRTSYRLLGIDVYDVDDKFPKITSDAFVGGTMPPGIVKLIYTVDLSGLKSQSWLRYCEGLA